MYPQSPSPLSAKMKPSSIRSPKRLGASSPHAQNLQLPGLPRFHPANYGYRAETASPASSNAGSPPSPNSPRQNHRQYSEAQRQLYVYQRDLVNHNLATAANLSNGRSPEPNSPRLHPLGSPGPVTPLELEGNDGYLLAGAKQQLNEDDKNEIIESYIKKEASKRHSGSSAKSSRHKIAASR